MIFGLNLFTDILGMPLDPLAGSPLGQQLGGPDAMTVVQQEAARQGYRVELVPLQQQGIIAGVDDTVLIIGGAAVAIVLVLLLTR